MSKILLLNGPNLNLLGQREPGHYGSKNLSGVVAELRETAAQNGHALEHQQSNSEAELVDTIQKAPAQDIEFILFNPAAFTHTSIALRDALLAVGLPFIEIHLSNVHAREEFRRHSYFSDIARGVIIGLGTLGYTLALQAAMQTLDISA